MRKFCVCLVIILFTGLISCTGYVGSHKKKEIKGAIDKVLSYDISYDDELRNYINEENFYTSNYRFFYTLFLGDLSSFEYNSKLVSVKKDGDQYVACLLLNLKAEGKEVYDNEETDGEGHRASAEGVDVPIEVVLKETKKGFYIKSVKEYDSLEIAKEQCNGFK